MIRIVLENILLFFLPTLVYLAYMLLTRKSSAPSAGGTAPANQPGLFDDAPLLYLFAAGVFLVIATLVAFGSNSGGRNDQTYRPPIIKDGRVEPGHFE